MFKLSTGRGQAIVSAFHKRFSLNLVETIASSKLGTKGMVVWPLEEDICLPALGLVSSCCSRPRGAGWVRDRYH